MKRKLLVLCMMVLVLVGCGSENNTSDSKDKDSKVESITLENGLEFKIVDKKLQDSYGKYYATENGALLVISIEVENSTKKDISFGASLMQLHINTKAEFSKTLTGEETEVEMITTIKAGETLEGTLAFASPAEYTKQDEVYIEFYDMIDTPLGELPLDLTSLKKEITDVTEDSGQAEEEDGMLVHEMSGYTVKMSSEPTFMTGEEFYNRYPEYSLGLQNQYRYLLVDAEVTNNSGSEFNISKAKFRLTDSYDDVFVCESYKMSKMDDAFDVEEVINDGETKSGKVLFIISESVNHVTISLNPVGGVNSAFLFEYDIHLQ